MKARKRREYLIITLAAVILIVGCSQKEEEKVQGDNILSDNIIITETGKVIEKEESMQKDSELEQGLKQDQNFKGQQQNAVVRVQAEDGSIQEIELREPKQQQAVTKEEQLVHTNRDLQLIFLGDSIFDNNRDGTGIPYLTGVQCEADVYNLAIAGTSATVEAGEKTGNGGWTSRSLCGITKAITKQIPTDIFVGTSAKEILDNPDIDFLKTDYFIIEYGTNDFFRAVPQSNENFFDMNTYAGALRYAVSNLKEYVPDATIILCSPCYAVFYNGNRMIGDGNVLNTGNGTLFDYKGTCNYVANESNSLFFNAYQDLGIDGYTAEEYLEDGVHLSAAGRQLYADALAKMILNYEETKNN